MISKHPLAEVFGFPISNTSDQAIRYRRLRLCPFNNKVPSCTKDKAQDPLGVCTIIDGENKVITCPIRFREDWLIVEDAASFFFPEDTHWTSLTEIRLNDRNRKSAGNIDLVLVSYDDHGQILDFGALEVQAVYISGNIRRPFAEYMKDPGKHASFDWSKEVNYPRADYLSSSRKRLVPQLIYKGGILTHWKKKIAVVLHESFFQTLPDLPFGDRGQADVAWFIYTLKHDSQTDRYRLLRKDTVYTKFQDALGRIATPEPGIIDEFLSFLQSKLDKKLEGSTPPSAPTLTELLEE